MLKACYAHAHYKQNAIMLMLNISIVVDMSMLCMRQIK